MSGSRPPGDRPPRYPQLRRSPPAGASPGRLASFLPAGDCLALLSSLQRVAATLARPGGGHRFFQTVVEEACALVQVEHGSLCLVEPEEPTLLRVRAGVGAFAEHEGEWIPLEGSLEGEAVRGGEAVRSADMVRERRAYRPAERGLQLGAGLAVPVGGGEVEGCLLLARDPGGAPFIERDAELMTQLGSLVGPGLAVVRRSDPGRRSRAEVEAWRRERQLEVWAARYGEALAETGQLLLVWDPADDSVEWGGGAEVVLGYESGELPSDSAGLLSLVESGDAPAVRRLLDEMAGGAREGSCRARVAAHGGALLPMRFWLRREEGTGAVVAVLRLGDGAERPDSRRPAQGASLDQLINALRHEINNPLASVMGQAQLLRSEPSLRASGAVRQSVDTILRESERIAELIKRLERVGADGTELGVGPLGGLAFPPERED